MNASPPFCHSRLVPFHFGDAAGVVFFGHAFTLAHEAFEHFVTERLGVPWSGWFEHPDWIVPVKQAEARYLAPIKVGEVCRVEITLSSRSDSAFTLKSSIYQQMLCCTVESVHVFCHRRTRRKLAIPAALHAPLDAAL